LKLADVDLDRGQIKITKKGNKEQYLHLNGETVRVLANYLATPPEAQNSTLFVGINRASLAHPAKITLATTATVTNGIINLFIFSPFLDFLAILTSASLYHRHSLLL